MKSMNAKRLAFPLGVLLGVLLGAGTASAEVHVTMRNGRVSIVAKDATLRQILAEWARVGQAKIVNVERIPGGPMTIELIEMPEAQALDILLRPLSGYLAAPRANAAADLSTFDRIVVMPTLASARPALASAPPPPVFQQPPMMAPPIDNEVEDLPPTGAPGQNPAAPRGPIFNAFPQPQVVNPQTQTGAAGVPGMTTPGVYPNPGVQQTAPAPNGGFPGAGAPAGVAVPGMIVQPPQQPGVIQPPQQPGQPVRRPGGE